MVATLLTPPKAIMGPMAAIECEKLMQASPLYKKYQETIDPVSAFEMLTDRINARTAEEQEIKAEQEEQKRTAEEARPRRGEKTIVEQVMGATITRQIGKEIVRGIFGMLSGKKPRSRSGGLFGF
ncbi:hypothetical protein D9M68_731940 [compost metagenome]